MKQCLRGGSDLYVFIFMLCGYCLLFFNRTVWKRLNRWGIHFFSSGVAYFCLGDLLSLGAKMNLTTITYDADKWQLVPRKLTPDQIKAIQMRTEIGAFVCDNWAGAYDLIQELFSAAIAAAPQPETLSPWLPIETAPSNTPVLLCEKYGDDICIAVKHDRGWKEVVSHAKIEGDAWLDRNIDNTYLLGWMPLPAPPKPEQGK